MKPSSPPVAAVGWICLCVWLNGTGWVLSALHQLNAAGYAVSFALGAILFVGWWQRPSREIFPLPAVRKIIRRGRRPWPALFLVVALLVFLGGFWYPPSNYDALTYRLPRMLQWLNAGHWLWIPTINDRMNYSGVGWEWVGLPFFSGLRSDRGMFLINALGFMLMPGLLFSICRRLGMARRVAWTWMWLLPLGYGFATQAGSIGNDLTGAVCCLLAIDFGLRARRSGRVAEVWLALLATAWLTGIKFSNLPLALPCLVAVWPALGRLRQQLFGSALVVILAIVVSAAPLMLLNQRHTGSWNGDPLNRGQMQLKNPVAGLLGNGVLVAEQSFMPPLLPGSTRFSERVIASLPDFLKRDFPRLRSGKMNEIPGEEGAGLGLGLALPLLLALGLALVRFRAWASRENFPRLLPPVALAAWVALAVCLAKLGSEAGPRLLLPYYLPALLPLLLLPVQGTLLRLRFWRGLLFLLALGVLPVLVLSVSRPLWPAVTVTARLAETHPASAACRRLAATYAAYAQRNDVLAPLRAKLPADAHEIGFIAGSNDTDYSLWRPFGQRRVRYLRADLPPFLAAPDLEWVVVKADLWPEVSPVPLATWAAEHHAELVATVPIVELVSWGPENWSVLHFPPPAAGGPAVR